MAVVANLFLMVTWLPACVVISEQMSSWTSKFTSKMWLQFCLQDLKTGIHNLCDGFNKMLVLTVVRNLIRFHVTLRNLLIFSPTVLCSLSIAGSLSIIMGCVTGVNSFRKQCVRYVLPWTTAPHVP